MTQVLNEGGTIAVARDYEQYDRDDDITLSTSYTNVLPIDAQRIRESTIQFTNKGEVAITYKIFGSALGGQKYKTLNPETSDSWINLLSSGTYDHTTETTIPTSVLATATITFVPANILAEQTITINGLVYTAKDTPVGNTQFIASTSAGVSSEDLKTAINADTRTGITVDSVDVAASVSGEIVTLTASETGDIGNDIDLSTDTSSAYTVSGALFTTGFSARAFETFTNPWRYVIVMIKAASGTPTAQVWHRAEN